MALSYYLTGIVSIFALFVLIDLFDNLDQFLTADDKVNYWKAVKTYIYSFPPFFHELTPLMFSLSAFFTLGRMQQNSQLIAVMASGISLHRVKRSYVALSIVIGVILFVSSETVLPWSGIGGKYLESPQLFQGKDERYAQVQFSGEISFPDSLIDEPFIPDHSRNWVQIEGLNYDKREARVFHATLFDHLGRPRLKIYGLNPKWLSQNRVLIPKGIIFPYSRNLSPDSLIEYNFRDIEIETEIPLQTAVFSIIDPNVLPLRDLMYFSEDAELFVEIVFRFIEPFYPFFMFLLSFILGINFLFNKAIYSYAICLVVSLGLYFLIRHLRGGIESGEYAMHTSIPLIVAFFTIAYWIGRIRLKI